MKKLGLLALLTIINLQAGSLGYSDIEKIAKYPEYNFEFIDKNLANDREFILSIIHYEKHCESSIGRCGENILEYANPKFKKDKEIVIEAFKEYRNLRYIDNSFKKDKNFILKLVDSIKNIKYDGECAYIKTILEFVDKELIDKDLLETSYNICSSSDIFKYMPKKLKSNREYAKNILKKSSSALVYFNDDIKFDKNFISIAINSEGKTNYSSFKYASKNLKKDKNFISKMININPHIFKYVNKNLQKDKNFVSKMMKINPIIFKYISEDLRKEKKLALMAVKIKGSLLRDLDENLKNDRELVSLAIKQNSQNIRYAGKDFVDLKSKKVLDKKILMILLKEDKKAYNIASDKLKKDKDVLKAKNEVHLSSCKSCHGQNFELIAMFTSKVVKNMSKAEIINALKGYKTGEYGGIMKSLMKSQVIELSNKDIENVASQIKE